MATARKLSQEHTSAACDRGTAALGRAFEFLGKRWNGVLLGTLRNGPAGFRELSRAVDGISDSVLSDRLSDLGAAGLIARTVPNGAEIACVTSCDHLIVAGVSNWGAYGMMAALAVLRPDWTATIARFLTAERDLAVTQAIVDKAGAVDGVTARREATVDGFGPEVHGPLIDELGRIAWGQAAD